MRAHLFRRAATMLVICSLGLAGACTNDDEPEPLPPETSTPAPTEPTPTTPPTAAEQATDVLTRYFEITDEFFNTMLVTERLNEVATGSAHIEVQGAIRELRENKITVPGEFGHRLGDPKKVSSKVFEIVDCEDSPTWISVKGKPIKKTAPNGDPLVNPLPTKYRVEEIKGRWLVTGYFWMGNRTC